MHGDRPRPLPAIQELERATDITERKESPSWDFDVSIYIQIQPNLEIQITAVYISVACVVLFVTLGYNFCLQEADGCWKWMKPPPMSRKKEKKNGEPSAASRKIVRRTVNKKPLSEAARKRIQKGYLTAFLFTAFTNYLKN